MAASTSKPTFDGANSMTRSLTMETSKVVPGTSMSQSFTMDSGKTTHLGTMSKSLTIDTGNTTSVATSLSQPNNKRDSTIERQVSAERIRQSRAEFFRELCSEEGRMSNGGGQMSKQECKVHNEESDVRGKEGQMSAKGQTSNSIDCNGKMDKTNIVINEPETEPCTIDEALEHVNEILRNTSDLTLEELAARGSDTTKLHVQFTTPDNRRVSIDQVVKVEPRNSSQREKKPVSQKIRKSFKRLKSRTKSKQKKSKHQSAFIHGNVCADDYIREQYETIKHYDFMFENLAFEGGGAKMIGYVGAITVSTILFYFLEMIVIDMY